jgi:hypothetical protein
MIYTKTSTTAIFLWPAVAINMEEDWWIELAWLNFAIGIKGKA